MSERNYWLDLFSGTAWQEFLDAGGVISGFSEGRWATVQRIKQGDYLLCYLTGVSRFIAVLEVVSGPFWDETPIWKDAKFPCRVRVRIVERLDLETAIPITQLSDKLSIFRNARSTRSWEGHVRGSPSKWAASDGEAVVEAIFEGAKNPIPRPLNHARLNRRHKLLKTRTPSASAPKGDLPGAEAVIQTIVPVVQGGNALAEEVAGSPNPTAQTEIQWLLLQLSSDMGYDVWVARNDRSREINGSRFADLPRLKKELSLRFDERVNQTIELIDVLWLKGNSIHAAFEIESTTSIYSGLLRMSDLIAMQPNLSIPLYLVAPDERRNKVMEEVTRPTFSRLSPPLHRVCRFISFNGLREHIVKAGPYIRFMTTEFLGVLSEEIVER